MKPRPRAPRRSGADVVVPQLLRIDAPRARTAKPVRILAGLTVGDAVEITASLVGQWLSQRFGRQFRECRTGTEGGLAIAAFHDKLSFDFAHDSACIAAIGLIGANAHGCGRFDALASDPPELAEANAGHSVHDRLFRFMADVDLIQLTWHGLARAYLNPRSSRVQVVFDELPGCMEFISVGERPPLSPAVPSPSGAARGAECAQSRRASAWYGLGVLNGKPAEIAGMLSRRIEEGLADLALNNRLLEHV